MGIRWLGEFEMKVFLTSVGERTTDLCRWQLERLGFEVVLLADKELWIGKYAKFLELARKTKENCLRIDADIICNKYIKIFQDIDAFIAKAHVYDLYRNEVWPLSPVYYSKEALQEIHNTSWAVDINRPETGVWRLFQKRTIVLPEVVGLHGFFQDKETIKRAKQNKIDRNQIQDYDFELVERIYAEDFH